MFLLFPVPIHAHFTITAVDHALGKLLDLVLVREFAQRSPRSALAAAAWIAAHHNDDRASSLADPSHQIGLIFCWTTTPSSEPM